MSVDERLVTALRGLNLPVYNAIAPGAAEDEAVTERYFVFNYTTLGADFGDDEPGHERFLIQVHLFAPITDRLTLLTTTVKQALFKAGFTWPDTVNATDQHGRHIVFECEDAEEAELYGEL